MAGVLEGAGGNRGGRLQDFSPAQHFSSQDLGDSGVLAHGPHPPTPRVNARCNPEAQHFIPSVAWPPAPGAEVLSLGLATPTLLRSLRVSRCDGLGLSGPPGPGE